MPRIHFHTNLDIALKQNKLAQENIKLAKLKEEMAKEKISSAPKKHTPYDEIPPPNDEEMAIIQERLKAQFEGLRACEQWEKRERLLSYVDDWP